MVLFHQHVIYVALFGAMLAARRTTFATLARRARVSTGRSCSRSARVTIGYRWFQLLATKAGPVALVLTDQAHVHRVRLARGRLAVQGAARADPCGSARR